MSRTECIIKGSALTGAIVGGLGAWIFGIVCCAHNVSFLGLILGQGFLDKTRLDVLGCIPGSPLWACWVGLAALGTAIAFSIIGAAVAGAINKWEAHHQKPD